MISLLIRSAELATRDAGCGGKPGVSEPLAAVSRSTGLRSAVNDHNSDSDLDGPGVLRGNTIRGNTTRNSERKMAL